VQDTSAQYKIQESLAPSTYIYNDIHTKTDT